MSAATNADGPKEVEEGRRIPVLITTDRTRRWSVTTNADGHKEVEEGMRIPTVITTDRTRHQSVLGNFGGPREVERDIRGPVVTMMDLPEQEEHQKNLETMKQEFEMLKNEYNEGIDTLKHDMEEAKKKEIQKIEKSANGQTENLAKYYHEAFIGLKNHYDATNESNLSIIAALQDENMELQRQESFLQMKFNTLSHEHELLKATIRKDADEINYIESERDALRSSFVSVIQYVEDRIKTKATHAEQKVQTIKENFQKEPALWDPSLMCLPASCQRHEIKEELTRILDYIGHLGITARQSGPHAGMSQGTSGTAPTYQ